MTEFEDNALYYYEQMLNRSERMERTMADISSDVMGVYEQMASGQGEGDDEAEAEYQESHLEYMRNTSSIREDALERDAAFQEGVIGYMERIASSLETQEFDPESAADINVQFAIAGADQRAGEDLRQFLEVLGETDEEMVEAAAGNIISFFSAFSEERMERLERFRENVAVLTDSISEVSEAEQEASANDDYQGMVDMTKAMVLTAGSLATFTATFAFFGNKELVGGVAAMVASVGLMVLASRYVESVDDPEEFGESLSTLSKTMLAFGGGLALFAGLAAGFGGEGILAGLGLMTASLGIMVGMTYIMDRLNVDLQDTGTDLMLLSVGMIAFAGSLGIVSYLTKEYVDVEEVTKFGAVLGVTAAATALMGKFSSDIVKGAVSMAAIAGSIGLFGWATSYAVGEINEHDLDDYLSTLAVITGSTLTVAGAGMLLPAIVPGAVALGLVGLSLGAVGMGMGKLQDVDLSSEHAEEIADGLMSFIKPYAAYGAMSPLVIAGSAALLAAAGSMSVTASALDDIPQVDRERMTAFEESVDSMLRTVAMDPTGASRLFGSDRPTLPEVLGGATAIAGASDSIIGIVEAMKAALGVDITDREWRRILNMVGRVPRMFAKVETQGGLNLFGQTIMMNDVQKGIDSIQGVSGELVGIVDALVAASDVELGDPKDPNSKFGEIKRMIGTVPSLFASIGRNDDSWWWEDSDVENGIEAVTGMGSELNDVVQSLSGISGIRNAESSSEVFAKVFRNYMEAIASYDYDNLEFYNMKRVFNSTRFLTDQITKAGQFQEQGGFNNIITDLEKITDLEEPIGGLTTALREMNSELEMTAGVIESMDGDEIEAMADKLELFIRDSRPFGTPQNNDNTSQNTSEDNSSPHSAGSNSSQATPSDVSQLVNEMNEMKEMMHQLILVTSVQAENSSKNTEETNKILNRLFNEVSAQKRNL